MIRETKRLTHGAMITALLGVLFLIDRQTAGLFNYVIGWIVPLPILVYAARYGLKSALAPFASGAFLAFIIATPITVAYAVMYGIIGLIYGHGVHRKWTTRHLFYATVVGTSIVFFISVLLFASFFGYNIQQEMQTIFQLLETIDVPNSINPVTVAQTSIMITYVTMVLMEAMVIHTLAKVLLSRFKIMLSKPAAIESIRFPKWVGALILITLFVYPLTVALDLKETYQTIGFAIYSWNVLILTYHAFVFVIIVQRRYKKKFLHWIVIAGMILLPSIFIDTMIIIGLLDILSDMRQRVLGVKHHA